MEDAPEQVVFDTFYRVDLYGQYVAGPFGTYEAAAEGHGEATWRVLRVELVGVGVAE